jgi:penicillin-binding protein 1A
MAFMMSKVVEEGTARRAILDGIKAAGKTGTTNAYRDAWFVGYTGNFVAGVWFGNDDYSPLNRMTGGSLPAQTWHEIMAYAHQGIELKTVAGLGPNPAATGPTLDKEGKDTPIKPAMLTNKGVQALLRVERLMDAAGRAMVAASAPAAPGAPATSAAPAPPAASTQPAPRPTAPGRADNKVGSVVAN